MSDVLLHLGPQRLRELTGELCEVLERYRDVTTRPTEPDAAARCCVFLACLPAASSKQR